MKGVIFIINRDFNDGENFTGNDVDLIVANINANETSINGLGTNKVDKVSGKSLVADTEISKIHSHTNSTVLNNTTASYTTTEQTKLSGISSGANVNNISDVNATDLTDTTDTSLHYHSSDRNRSNHTGTQSASTIVQDSSNRLVTDAEKSTWNSKASTSVATTSINGLMSNIDKTRLDNTLENTVVANNVDLNTVVKSGTYRLNQTHANAPSGVTYGQLLVIHGGADTITQIASGYGSSALWFRSGNPTDVGGSGSWSSWFSTYTSGNKPTPADLGINMGGVSGTPIDISSTDLNNLKTTGFYKGITMTNAPSANWWYVLCTKHDDAWVYQEVTAYSATSQNMEKYYRVLYANIWSSWDLVYTSRNPPITNGTTATRPTATYIGQSHFDTTLGKPIWWNGTLWKDATGTIV